TLHTEHAGLQGTRQLTAADCPTLVRSVTLVLALAFGAGVELSEPTPTPPAAALPAPAPAPAHQNEHEHEQDSAPLATLAADSGDHPATWHVWLGAGAQFALLPAPAFTGSLGAELHRSHWSIGLRAQIFPGVSNDTTLEGRAVTSHFAALGAAARACGLLPLGPVALGGCASLQLAAIRGRSDDTRELQSSSATAPWYSLAAGLQLDWPRTAALRLRLEADLALSLNRPEFGIEDLGSVYRVPRWAPLLAAGILISL
ncbi:MAG TPA: hypothetical protein VJV78_32310, partial [Polyangiales bacterium]|nr:hypothetical protein [Polyangiales bacterium]